MTLSDVFVRWFLLRGLIVGVLFFCIEHFIAIPEASVAWVALCALAMPVVFFLLGLMEYAKRDRATSNRSRSS